MRERDRASERESEREREREKERERERDTPNFRVCIHELNNVITPRKGCPNSKAPPNAPHKCGLLFPLFGGCTAIILHGQKRRKKERKKVA